MLTLSVERNIVNNDVFLVEDCTLDNVNRSYYYDYLLPTQSQRPSSPCSSSGHVLVTKKTESCCEACHPRQCLSTLWVILVQYLIYDFRPKPPTRLRALFMHTYKVLTLWISGRILFFKFVHG